MNLDMHEEVIDRLTNRGLAAAEALIARFVGAAPTDSGATAWNEHRWVRFRTAAASLERWLRRFHDVYCADARPFETAFPDWLDLDHHAAPPVFEWSQDQAAVARTRTGALVDLGALWEEPGFDSGRRRDRCRIPCCAASAGCNGRAFLFITLALRYLYQPS